MPLPLIAIVGRPNVGKSTLFNRLAGRRIAIVSDVPGTTRDRVSVDATWRDRRFIVVDTGGFVDSPSGSAEGTPAVLWEHVQAQAQRALDLADGVVLVVDAVTGLVPPDTDAADLVRRSGKPWVVAVNKADNPARAQAVHDFHRLGGGPPLPVSAYHGEGIDDLLAALMDRVPRREEEADDLVTPRVAIVGRPNVGKSALYNAIVGEERSIVSPMPGTTRDPIDTRVRYGDRDITFIDTAGLRRPGKSSQGLEKFSALRTLQSIERCHVAVVLLDGSEFVTEHDAHVAGYVDQAGRAAVIVVNKWDLARKADVSQTSAIEQVRDRFKFLPVAPVLFTTAITGYGVEQVMSTVFQVYDEFTSTLPQEELNKALAAAVSARPPPPKGVKRVRITGIRQVRTAPPTLALATNAPELIHFSYRRYLQNRFRETFGFTGSPLRLEFTSEQA